MLEHTSNNLQGLSSGLVVGAGAGADRLGLTAHAEAVLACDECYPRRSRAVWIFQGVDAGGTPWRAATCDRHVSMIEEELAERGGRGALEPAGKPLPH